MFDLKVINSVLDQLEEERGISKEKVIEAIGDALAIAYKKEYGKRSQIIKADFDIETGNVDFYQIKVVVDESTVIMEDEEEESIVQSTETEEVERKVKFNEEHHILLEDAKKIKKDAVLGDEIVFPLEKKGDYGRISAQTAKQMIIQKIREAEKISVYKEFEEKEGDIVNGTVQRVERGNIFVDLGRITGILPFEEQIASERFRNGDRIRALLYSVEENPKGIYLRLSRSRPEFLKKLFEIEAPEIASGVVEIKEVAREPGSRSKIAVLSNDEYIDPVGSCVGQRGVRVNTVSSELGGEKIDIIEWSEDPSVFIERALAPAVIIDAEIDENEHKALIKVTPDQQSLAIGKGGQNVRLAAKLTGWKIDISEVKPSEIDKIEEVSEENSKDNLSTENEDKED